MATQFVKMHKDGETIGVNPLCVDDHKRLGWKELETPAGRKAEQVSEKNAAQSEKPAGPSLKEQRKAYAKELDSKTDEELVALANQAGIAEADKKSRGKLLGELMGKWDEANG